MLNRKNPINRVMYALMGAVVVLTMVSSSAKAGEWPLVLPTARFGEIPDGQGMDFFIGEWNQVAKSGAGIKITITSDSLVYPSFPPPVTEKYRVIYEQSNFILTVALLDTQESGARPSYTIFTVEHFGPPTSRITAMSLYFCGYGTLARKEAFDWPTEKLLELFKTSVCLSKMEIKLSTHGDWGGGLFQRAEPAR